MKKTGDKQVGKTHKDKFAKERDFKTVKKIARETFAGVNLGTRVKPNNKTNRGGATSWRDYLIDADDDAETLCN